MKPGHKERNGGDAPPKLRLRGEFKKRYEQIREYRKRYGISPFDDERLETRSPGLYRSIEQSRRKNGQ
ncbi:hypothetical protein AGMMS50229_20420 [Campylobacterota bacterium]|jgi:hypothetical protein|nr:hypothetical protein AGMMS50229_20420 [Campylobacterota bacterium]